MAKHFHILSNSRRYEEYYAPFPPNSFAPKSGDQKLDVAIIGAGIAGLTAAVGLLQSGHNVELYERSEFAMEIGAAINVCPNAARILSYYEFNFLRAMPVTVEELNLADGHTFNILKRVNMPDLEAQYGAPWFLFHRVDLHKELMRLATEPRPSTAAVAKINLLSEISDVDLDGNMTLENGKQLKRDLIVVADGIRTRFVSKVVGDNVPIRAKATGTAVYRFLVPTSELLDDSQTRYIYERGKCSMYIARLKDARLNFGFFHPDQAEATDDEVFNIPATKKALMESCRDLHPDLQAICSKAHDLKLWRLCERDKPIPELTKGRVVIIGDAAHPMLPPPTKDKSGSTTLGDDRMVDTLSFIDQGQGGGMAIEDGAALGVLLSGLRPDDTVEDRLALFQRLRLNRVSAMQVFSSVGQDEAARMMEQARPYVEGPIPASPDQFHDYNFTPNIIRDAQELLSNWRSNNRGRL